MKPNAEREDLAARGKPETGRELCPKCFETRAVAASCVDPSCPFSGDVEAEAAATIYPELAKANLMRMRGEYKLARDTCLALLKRFPNNADAHTLLGDIEAEEGDLDHAAQWYEMALDLRPESESDQHKLEVIRRRIAEREAMTTAQQLGLPTTRSRAMVYGVLIAVFIVLVGVTAFILGDRSRARRGPTPPPITTPIEIGKRRTEPDRTEPPQPIAREHPSPTPTPPAGPIEDQSLTQRLTAECAEGRRIVSAVQDPRDRSVAITAAVDDGASEREVAALIGVSALQRTPATSRVTVRIMRSGELAFVADVTRAAVDQAVERIGDLSEGQYDREALLSTLSATWPE